MENRRRSTPIVRAIKHVHEVLHAGRNAVKEDRLLILLRDRAGEIERAAELLNTEAKHALEYEIAEQGETQAKISSKLAEAGQRLNLLAALFLPLTAIASVFGMNLRSCKTE